MADTRQVDPDYSLSPAGSDALPLAVPASCAGLRLDQALSRLLPEHSRSRLQSWVKAGQVTVEGKVMSSPSQKVWGGERIEVHPLPGPEETAHRPEAIALDIVHEDRAVLVVNKPAGLVVHPGSGNWAGTLLNALLHHAPGLAGLPRAGIVHRLDKETSGLLVVAKTLPAQTSLVRQLQTRAMGREYLALAWGQVAADGTVDAPIGRHPTARTRMAVAAQGRPAVTHYQVLERFVRCALLRCRLTSGRTHQIRVHMASIGHPLVGDPVYGKPARGGPEDALARFPRQALHAQRLALLHPETGQAMAWESPLPQDLSGLLAELRNAS